MGVLKYLAVILAAGALYYWLTRKVIEKYREAWIDGKSFGIRIVAYTALYYLMALYAVFDL
ncbi:hypothetical protein [Thermococcus sp.]|uniref:hypothetical protein n=1 Tax=Thermococcus sp. TaxID=35749 RepID=UPI00262F6E73|nr:hypothetical protein [Thermococcus sp.]